MCKHYIGKFEATWETALVRELNQGPLGDCLMKKPSVEKFVALSLFYESSIYVRNLP
jgi:hypothetical protein